MNDFKKILISTAIIAFVVGMIISVSFSSKKLLGGNGPSRVETITALDGVSASTTSGIIDITGADRATLSLNVSNLAASGLATSTFAVTVSADGTNYVTYNKLIDNVANSISQNVTRVASVAIDSNTTKIYSLDLESDVFKFMKVTDTITGTTTSVVTVKALVDYK